MSRDETRAAVEPEETGSPLGEAAKVLLLLAATLGAGFLVYRAVVAEAEGPGEGMTTGYDWEVVGLDGEPVDLASFRGRPVFLNVWATWCPPCRAELPSIARLSERAQLDEADVAVLLVSVDDERETVRRFAERADLGEARVLFASGPPPEEFRTQGIPATFLIAPDGTIVDSEIGSRDWDTDQVAGTLARLAAR